MKQKKLNDKDRTVMPVLAEEIEINKLDNLKAQTVIRTSVVEDLVPFEVELKSRGFKVARRTIDVAIEAVPDVYYEGDTMVVPIVEERLVKQLFLSEELLIVTDEMVSVQAGNISLRREQVDIERFELHQPKEREQL